MNERKPREAVWLNVPITDAPPHHTPVWSFLQRILYACATLVVAAITLLVLLLKVGTDVHSADPFTGWLVGVGYCITIGEIVVVFLLLHETLRCREG